MNVFDIFITSNAPLTQDYKEEIKDSLKDQNSEINEGEELSDKGVEIEDKSDVDIAIDQDLDNIKLDYGEINDFVNDDIENEGMEKQNYKDHIRQLFSKMPLSIDKEQEKLENLSDLEEPELNSCSNHALDSKKVDIVEELKENNFLNKSEFQVKPKFGEGSLEEFTGKLPGTVPDLGQDLHQYGQEISKFDSNIENFINEPEENVLPDNFGEMLDGKKQDMEKVVYFSTLNSQDHMNKMLNKQEEREGDENIQKFKRDLNNNSESIEELNSERSEKEPVSNPEGKQSEHDETDSLENFESIKIESYDLLSRGDEDLTPQKIIKKVLMVQNGIEDLMSFDSNFARIKENTSEEIVTDDNMKNNLNNLNSSDEEDLLERSSQKAEDILCSIKELISDIEIDNKLTEEEHHSEESKIYIVVADNNLDGYDEIFPNERLDELDSNTVENENESQHSSEFQRFPIHNFSIKLQIGENKNNEERISESDEISKS